MKRGGGQGQWDWMWGVAVNRQSPPQRYASSNTTVPLTGPVTSPNNTMNWGPSVQTPAPLPDPHRCHSFVLRCELVHTVQLQEML